MRSKKPRNVGRVAGQHFVGQRQSLERDHQGDDDLHTIRPMIAAVAVAALVGLAERPIGLEVGAGQVVQQHVEAGVEQVALAPQANRVQRADMGKAGREARDGRQAARR